MDSQPLDNPAPPPDTSPAPPAPGSLPARIRGELVQAFSGIDAAGAVAATVATAALIVSHHHGNTGTYRRVFAGAITGGTFSEIAPYLYWFGASSALYLLLPLLATALTPGIRVRETGFGLGDKRTGFAITGLVLLVFLPIVFAASRFEAFAGHYPLCSGARKAWSLFLAYELAYATYFVAWEYLYRGYLLFSLERSIGKMAVFAQMMPFAIIHFGKPEAETFGAIIAGVFLGLLALRTRSFWYGAFIHIAVAVTMDVLTAWGALTGIRPG